MRGAGILEGDLRRPFSVFLHHQRHQVARLLSAGKCHRHFGVRSATDPQRASDAARRLLTARNDLARNVNVGLVVLDALLDAESRLHRTGA